MRDNYSCHGKRWMGHSFRQSIIIIFVLLLSSCVDAESPNPSDPVVKEMDKLSAPSHAVRWAPCKYSVKSASQRLYSCLYKDGVSFSELLGAYRNQLQVNGWRELGITKLRSWGRDLGGEDATYCKGSLQLNLQFAGERAQYGWSYAISTSVGVPPYSCSK